MDELLMPCRDCQFHKEKTDSQMFGYPVIVDSRCLKGHDLAGKAYAIYGRNGTTFECPDYRQDENAW